MTLQNRQDSLIGQLQGAMAGMARAGGKVTGGGGSTYTLTSATANVTSVAGQATGRCRVVLDARAASTNDVWPSATVLDNTAFHCTCIVVDESPVTFDVYAWSDAGAATNRTFTFTCDWQPG